MTRTDGQRRTPSAPLLATAVVLAATAIAAGCGASEAVKDAAIAKLAIGTWRCTPDVAGVSSPPFDVQIRTGGFSVELDDDTRPPIKLPGTWKVEGGDLQIKFTGPAAGAPAMRIRAFDALTADSTHFTLDDPGFVADKTEADGTTAPVEFAVEARGTDSVTLQIPTGDPWTCDRQ